MGVFVVVGVVVQVEDALEEELYIGLLSQVVGGVRVLVVWVMEEMMEMGIVVVETWTDLSEAGELLTVVEDGQEENYIVQGQEHDHECEQRQAQEQEQEQEQEQKDGLSSEVSKEEEQPIVVEDQQEDDDIVPWYIILIKF